MRFERRLEVFVNVSLFEPSLLRRPVRQSVSVVQPSVTLSEQVCALRMNIADADADAART